MIWCPVLLHVNVGQNYNLYGLLSLVATAYFVFFEKLRIKIKFRDFIFYKSYILLAIAVVVAIVSYIATVNIAKKKRGII